MTPARDRAGAPGPIFVPHDIAASLKGADSGPLAGLTCAIKDMYDIAGERTGGGSPDWLTAHPPASAHSAAVAKLLAAGATIVGKTICDEFFFSVSGTESHYGTPPNPRAPGRVPGGSSSGSAAAVAAGLCDFALGSDTGGSVRIPAALCGVLGIRTTLGRVDLTGAMAMAPSFDAVGWFANDPAILRRVGGVLLEGARVDAPIAHLLIADDGFANADAEVGAVIREALALARDRLPEPAHETAAPADLDPWREAFRNIQGREIWGIYGDFIERKHPSLRPAVKDRMDYSATVTAEQAEAARRVQDGARERVHALLPAGTIMALPTAPCIAPRADMSADALNSFRTRVMRLTCIAGLSGLPQISIPVGTVGGCPVALSLIGWAGGDEALLELAERLSSLQRVTA